MSWTKRQRIEAVFSGEQPDRVPIYDILVNDAAVELYSGEKLDVEGGYKTVCKAISNCLDMTRDIFGPNTVSDGVDRRGNRWHKERWTHWWVSRYFDNDRDKLIEYIKNDIDVLRASKYDKGSISAHRNRCSEVQHLIGDTVDIFVCVNIAVNYAFNVIGMMNFCEIMYDEPDLVDVWLKAASDAEYRRIEALADRRDCPVSLIYADVAHKSNLIFPFAYLEKYLIPDVAAVCDLLHSKGMKVIFHSDGNIMKILPQLKKAGVDGLNPLEIMAGMDIKAIRETYGRGFIICGGMDVSSLMPFGTKDEVIHATKNLLRLAGPDYGLCIGSSTELGDDIPIENIKAMFETVWEYGRYPIQL